MTNEKCRRYFLFVQSVPFQRHFWTIKFITFIKTEQCLFYTLWELPSSSTHLMSERNVCFTILGNWIALSRNYSSELSMEAVSFVSISSNWNSLNKFGRFWYSLESTLDSIQYFQITILVKSATESNVWIIIIDK